MIDFSPIQILIVLAIALIVFGPRRLPEMAKSVGKGVREFKASIAMDEPPRSPEPRATATAGEPVTATATATAAEPAAPAAPAAIEDGDVLEGVLLPGDEQPPGAR
ncbi:MAG: twin-arginine translocase TatA/TatE family subunit [Thermoleophilia bacterium]